MANQTTTEDEVFDFSNTKFTREDLINALNEMVHEYRKLYQTFEEIKAENKGLKNSSVESSNAQLEDTDSLNIELTIAGVSVAVEVSVELAIRCDDVRLSSKFLGTFAVIIVTQKYKDARASGNTALSSPCWDLLATMRRVVNYHSSWARQRQVELLDASGNPGFTAGRGFNPAGGAPGGG
ncbi:hypothetical protein F511_10817 [Dorcoceras hygrometricum]|uniref:Uncharacterized protein n=1 Tax=Dorcoceras hygrometricum TaxID=472368 RepID=A0A2Z7B8Q0_9LAMI|nr:hypothetical protein F511_10817 [Dorcoceras hygrometricum]